MLLTAGQYFLQLQDRTVVEIVVCEVFSVVRGFAGISSMASVLSSVFSWSFLELRRSLFVDGHLLAMLFLPLK